ncbi:MAG: GNAT family N-acetyltransferase [Cyanobacteria bacterium]|nr:GNAT family N-acetyltransferase [Cyanobacteriota bacterium]MDA0865678.1 GNAT family N-acetyltransferase [Cyanobacteriota bacterium]
MQWNKAAFTLTDEPPANSLEATYQLLSRTYWAQNRPLEKVEGILAQSLCVYLLNGTQQQIGFARVISDYVTTAWVADVVVAEAYRGQGLGAWMVTCLMAHPQVKGAQFILQTKDAHRFYEQFGFEQNSALMSTRVDHLPPG